MMKPKPSIVPRRIALLLLLVLGALALPCLAAAASDPALAELQARIARPALLRAQFTQEKRVAGFRNPLRSQGHFVLARDKGVIWSVEAPFVSQMVLTRERILSRQADGSVRVEADSREQPALRSVNAMMLALMGGNLDALTSSFQAQATLEGKDGWALRLTPRSSLLAKAFVALRLRGDRYVREVEIEEANGDRTVLHFDAFAQAPALSAEEDASLE